MDLNVQSPQDINYLRQLLASGQISEADLQNLSVSDSGQNQLPAILNPPAPPHESLRALEQNIPALRQPSSYQPPPASSQDMRAQGQQFVRNENTGQTIPFGPQGMLPPQGSQQDPRIQNPAYQSTPQLGPQVMGNQAPQGQMRVVGAGNGVTMDLGMQPYQPVPLDSRRGQIDIPGVGRGDYGQDGNAYVKNPDGSTTKVLLGYDAGGSMALNKANLENQKTQADIAATQERTRASQIQNPDFSNQGGAATGPQGPTGDAFLQTLDPQMAAQVKAYAEGRIAFPAGFALKSPYFQNMMRLVGQYDPTFDAVNYNARAKTRQDFTSGQSANNITALNTAVQHLGNLAQAYQALDNGDFPTYNRIANFVGQQLGVQKIQGNLAAVSADSTAVAHELAKVFRQSGMSEGEIADWQKQIDPNAPPAQAKAAINTALNLMQGRLEALGARYNQGMGTSKNPLELLTPQAQQIIQNLSGVTPPANAVGAQAPGMLPVQGQPQGQNSIPPAAVAYLRQNPGMRVAFDMKYGQGASAQVLGQ